ncbi:signal peptidase I [Bacillus sp. 2205SS5-2]|uniref:signal peptidase I n=1 Tax=Bacillus sp. 2205SS5-2 TaxID=3109031 RepID=UPI003003E816
MKEDLKREGKEWIKALGMGLILFVIIRLFLFDNYTVEGQSMMPTIKDGNKLIVNKIGYSVGNIDRFDIVVFHANDEEDYVKRVIGLPGDSIMYQNDVLYVNGKAQEEPYLEQFKKQYVYDKLTGDFSLEDETSEAVVPEGKLFVLGDNRRGSTDSRHFGFVDEDNVVGEVGLRYWPIDEWEFSLK